jgi:hypothetical protein
MRTAHTIALRAHRMLKEGFGGPAPEPPAACCSDGALEPAGHRSNDVRARKSNARYVGHQGQEQRPTNERKEEEP